MKAPLAKALRREWQILMRSYFPEFTKMGTFAGGVVYRHFDDAVQRYIYIYLQPHSKNDSFIIEFAASRSVEYPFDILPGQNDVSGVVRARINEFSSLPVGGWWNLNRSHEANLD